MKVAVIICIFHHVPFGTNGCTHTWNGTNNCLGCGSKQDFVRVGEFLLCPGCIDSHSRSMGGKR